MSGHVRMDPESTLLGELKLLDEKRAFVISLLNSIRATTKGIPNDVLLYIFSFLCPLGSRNSRSSSVEHPTADLRRVAQVCSMWRSVALASPNLWSTRLDFNDEALPWLEELLRRCDSIPIHITANFSSPCYTFHRGGVFKTVRMIDKFQIILSSCPNIGSFSVVYDRYSPLLAIIESFLSQRCTSATRLSFSTRAFRPRNARWQTAGELLPSLSNHRLHQLEVNGYRPDLTLSCFRQLAELSVSCLSGITANDWVRALAGLPELVHLRLDNAISSNTPKAAFLAESVKFAHLKTLALIGEFDQGIGDFLLAVEAMKKYSLLLHCTLSKHSDLDQLLRGLQQWFDVWKINLDPDVSRRRLDFMASHSRFRLHNQIPEKELSDEWFRIFFNWRGLANPHCLRTLQADIFQVFAPVLRQTRTLSICPDTHQRGYICSPGFWQEYFHGVRTLRFLNSAHDGDIDDSTTNCFIDALCNDIERSTSPNILPLLRVLSFECENFLDNRMRSLERLSMLLGYQIDIIELYACKGKSNVRNLFRIFSTESKSPRF